MTGLSSADRVQARGWSAVSVDLDAQGCGVMRGLLTGEGSNPIAGLCPEDNGFSSRAVMARHGFGRGEYRYFSCPSPPVVQDMRTALYPHLAAIANRWHGRLDNDVRFSDNHAAFIKRCHDAGQTRPTPLLLQYGKDDHNCLHQDLYGEHGFPPQAVVLWSEPGKSVEGGELVLVEHRPRMLSRPEVVPLRKRDAVVVAVNSRPVRGARGVRMNLRHGINRLCSEHRHTLGIIFHDAA